MLRSWHEGRCPRTLMLRFSQALSFVVPALVATACPMYGEDCNEADDCAVGYVCSAGACISAVDNANVPPDPDTPPRCQTTADCAPGLECDRYKRCMPPDSSGGASGGAGSPGGASGGDDAPGGAGG